MKKCFYVENEQYSKNDFVKALNFSCDLAREDSTIGRIVVLLYSKTQCELISPFIAKK